MTDTTQIDTIEKVQFAEGEELDHLTPRQLAFCHEYLVDLNATKAALRAGYNDAGAAQIGNKLLNRPDVRAYIQEYMNQRANRTKITSDYVLSTIKETIERCRQAEPVLDKKGRQVYVATPDGDEVPAFTFDAKGVLKGAELLGKHLKLFTDVQEHKHSFVNMQTVEITRPDLPGSPSVKLTFDIGGDPERPKTPG